MNQMTYREVTYKGEGEENLQKRIDEIIARNEQIIKFEIVTYEKGE